MKLVPLNYQFLIQWNSKSLTIYKKIIRNVVPSVVNKSIQLLHFFFKKGLLYPLYSYFSLITKFECDLRSAVLKIDSWAICRKKKELINVSPSQEWALDWLGWETWYTGLPYSGVRFWTRFQVKFSVLDLKPCSEFDPWPVKIWRVYYQSNSSKQIVKHTIKF